MGTILRGWARAEQGQTEKGIAQVRQGLAAFRATGAELATTRWVALLAEAWGKAGQPEEGLNVLAEALAVVSKGGERDYEAELYRLRGELTLQSRVQSRAASVKRGSRFNVQGATSQSPSIQHLASNTQSEAEECFWRAIEIARRQQAKTLELRAVMSLSRLWQRQGKKAEARQILAEVYSWFTEGFETQDLRDAKALLNTRA
jgi:predicted ATPase